VGGACGSGEKYSVILELGNRDDKLDNHHNWTLVPVIGDWDFHAVF